MKAGKSRRNIVVPPAKPGQVAAHDPAGCRDQGGEKLDDFLIDKSARKGRKRRKSKP